METKDSSFPADKWFMYINAQSPPVLTLAVPGEISIRTGMESQPLKLEPYQIVRAVVAEGGLEKVVLNVEHQKLLARTKVPLKSGQQLNLQVLSTHPRIHLRIMEEAELRHLFRTLHSLSDSVRLLPVIAKMHNNPEGQLPMDVISCLSGLIGLLRTSPTSFTGSDLARLYEMLGLNLEALLANSEPLKARKTLKAALLMFSGSMTSQHAGHAGIDTRGLLEQLNLFGLCQYRLGQENVQFLPLPLPFLEFGYILAERETEDDSKEEDENKKGAWKMSLNLKLSFFGNLQIHMRLEDNGTLCLRILCESEEKAGIISKAIPALKARLTSVALEGVLVGTGALDPVAGLLKRIAPHGDHFLAVEA